MSVIVALPINRTGVYHTKECTNCEEIANPREISKEKAERIGLVECVHCRQAYKRDREQDTKHYRALRDANSISELKEQMNASD